LREKQLDLVTRLDVVAEFGDTFGKKKKKRKFKFDKDFVQTKQKKLEKYLFSFFYFVFLLLRSSNKKIILQKNKI
jgi:hypothetical protein